MAKAAVEGFYRMIFDGLSPEGRASPELTVRDVIVDGRWTALHFEMSGAHRGPFMGYAPTGRPYRIAGVTMMRFGDSGRVVERRAAADIFGLLVQIGAVAPPPG